MGEPSLTEVPRGETAAERFWRRVALTAMARLVEIRRRDELRAWIARAEQRNAEIAAQFDRDRLRLEALSAQLRDALVAAE